MAKITIIGIGRLGLCAGLCFEQAGHQVLGIDINPEYVAAINNKTLKSFEPEVENILKISKNLRATTSLQEGLEFSDIIYIYIDTPTGVDEMYDCSKLDKLFATLNNMKVANKQLIIGCTVMPGYTATAQAMLADCPNTLFSYHPEFIAQGNIINGLRKPDMLLIGEGSPQSGTIIENIALTVAHDKPRICRMTPTEAEICKISTNGFITMKVAYANLIGDLCKKCDANPLNVLSAIGADSRIGSKYFSYGYSFGGPCFPRDTVALSKVLDKTGLDSTLVTAIGDTNDAHAVFQAQELLRQGGEIFTFENVTYKENCLVPIIEHSAKLKIAKELTKHGKTVIIKDHAHILALVEKEFGDVFHYQSI